MSKLVWFVYMTAYPCDFSRGDPDDIDNEENDNTEDKTLQLGELVQAKHPPVTPPIITS